MSKIPSNLIKELRDRTSVGIIKCKEELINSNGNIQLAINNMKKNGLITAAKRSGKITAEGIILTKTTTNKKNGIILEINCETDFVAKNNKFNDFCNMVSTTALEKKITNIDTLRNNFQDEKNMLISIFDENINIRRIGYIEGDFIGNYLHNKKIGVILSVRGLNPDRELVKYIAMHITVNKPEYIDIHHIPINIINQEKIIQMDIAIRSGKSKFLAQKIVEGRINKFLHEISLLNQVFIMDKEKTIADLLNENNITIAEFIRFEVGENI